MCGPFSYKQEETWFLLYSQNNKNLFHFDIKNDHWSYFDEKEVRISVIS